MKGSLRHRGPGTWELTIDLGRDGQGKRRRKFETLHGNKSAAQRRLRELLTQLDKGLGIPTGKVLLKDWLDRWMKEAVIPYRRQQTIEKYRCNIVHHLLPAMGELDIARITPSDIQALQAGLMAHYQPETIRSIRSVLSTALNHAMKMELIFRNPSSLVPYPKVKKHELIPAGIELIRAALDLGRTKGHYLYPVAHLIAYTGMRRGEALALTWDNVDLGDGRVIVEASLGYSSEVGFMVEEPKTASGRRVVDLDATTIDVLSDQWDAQQQLKRSMGDAFVDRGRVFTNPMGGWVHPKTISRWMVQLGAKVGAQGLTVRSLRHFHASVLLQSGQNVVVVSKRLGHSSVSITTDTYAHSLPGWQKQLAEDFRRMMEG